MASMFTIPTTMKAFVVHETVASTSQQQQQQQQDASSISSDAPSRNNALDNGKLLTNYPVPIIPSPSYALLRILRAGICNTDLEILQGYMGFTGILGHEFVGTVMALHDNVNEEVKDTWLGKRVCGDINLGCCNNIDFSTSTSATISNKLCGVCSDSLGFNSKNPQMSRNHCPNRTVLGILNQNGTFCEYMILPIRNLHVVPEDMSNQVAVFAEPLAAACRVVEQGLVNFRYNNNNNNNNDRAISTRGGDRVAILGDGKLGLCVAEILGREYLRCWQNTSGDDDNDETTTTTTTTTKTIPPPPRPPPPLSSESTLTN